MPIKKENIKRYPANWNEISKDIRFNRAGNKCEKCGIQNYIYINKYTREICLRDESNAIRVVLTVAHLDHQPENCDYSNLMAMCQKCHNIYDRKHRNQTLRNSRNIGQLKLF
jgi:hypothetical protein